MRALLGIIVVLVMAVGITLLLLPPRLVITEEIEVQAIPERVYGLVANIKEWSSWYPMYRTEPLASYLYEGNVMQPGSKITYSGLDIGRGEIELVNANPPFLAEFVKTNTADREADTHYTFNMEELAAGKVRVAWTYLMELSPFQHLAHVFKSNKEIKAYLQGGLRNLKEVSELRPIEAPAAPLDPFPDVPSDF